MSDTSFDTLNNLNVDALYDSRVSVNNFSTSNEEITKSKQLEEAKALKLKRLQEAKGKTDLEDSFTQLENGTVESNQNKIWNQLSNRELQSAFTYALDNNTLSMDDDGNIRNSDGSIYSGNTRRLYMYGSKDSTDDVVKLGLSRGDESSSDSRYTRFPSGEMGVNTDNKILDVLLPENVAVTLEGMAHGREESLKGRRVPDIYEDPELRNQYGKGVTEYYNDTNALFGTPEAYDEQVGRTVLNDMLQRNPSHNVSGSFSERVKEVEAQNADVTDRLLNTAQGAGAAFVDTLIASPLNAIGQLTDTYSFGEADEVTDNINKFFGYNDVHVQKTMEGLKEDWNVLTSDEATLGQKIRAATNAIVDSATTPELLGTSLGTIAAWVTPAVVLKGLGVGAQLGSRIKKIDDLLDKGKITSGMAKAAKRKAYISANGGKALAVNQSGQLWSAVGATNAQYNEFVKNNNGVELEGVEKAEWFGKAMTFQVLNQNLDKLVDVQAMKFGGLLPSLKAVAKDMPKDQLVKVTDIMMGTAKAIGILGGSMASEALQEYTQTTMELYNERMGSEQYKDLDSFMKFVMNDENIDEAGVAMLAGAGGAVQFNAAGKIGAGLSKAQQLALTKEGIKNLKESAAKLKRTDDVVPRSNEQPTDEDLQVGESVEDVIQDEEVILTPEQENVIAANTVAPYVEAIFGDIEEAKTLNRFNPDQDTGDTLDLPNFENSVKDIIQNSTEDVNKVLKDLEKAELHYSQKAELYKDRKDNSDEDKAAFMEARNSSKVARLAKREYLKHIMEQGITLGSGTKPEDIIDDLIDSSEVVDGIVQVTEEEKTLIKQYAEDNDIPESRWASLLANRSSIKVEGKDAQEVYEEALASGEISASNRRKAIRDLINTANPDKRALTKAVAANSHFLKTQVDRKAAFDKAIAVAEEKVNSFNTRKRKGEELPVGPESKQEVKKGVKVKGYDEFVAITEDKSTGLLKIHPASLEIQSSIQDNISYLKRTNERYGKVVDKILGTASTKTAGISIRPAVKDSIQKEREKDEAWYKRTGVTKVIVDEDNPSTQWSVEGDYYKDNAHLVNTGEYTEDDVVLFVTEATKHPKKAKFFAELTKAREAGATVVVERSHRESDKKPHSLLKNTHFHPAKVGVTEKSDGYTAYHSTKEKAEEFSKKSEAKKTARLEKKKKYNTLHKAFYENNQEVIEEITDELFKGDISKSTSWYENKVDSESGEIAKELEDIATSFGVNSPELNDAMIKYTKDPDYATLSVEKGFDAFNTRIEKLQEGNTVIAEWRKALQEAKKGELDYDKWINDNVSNPKVIMENLLKNSVGNVTPTGESRESIKVYYNAKKDIWSVLPKTKEAVEALGDVVVQTISLNPNDYVQVAKTTVLNSYVPSDINIEGPQGARFNSLVKTAVEKFNNAIAAPNLDIKEKIGGKETGKVLKTSFTDLLNSPAASLVYEVTNTDTMNLKVNESVAVAMQMAIGNLIKNNGPYLKPKQKSRKAVAEMLGLDENRVTQSMVDLIGDKGMLYKNLANSAGKDVANLLGISRKSNNDIDSQAYDSLVADLGQMAVLIAIEDGLLRRDNTVSASRYANVMLGKVVPDSGSGNDAKVSFISTVPDKDHIVDSVSYVAKELDKLLPDTDVSRKEPLYTEPTDKEVDKIVNNALRNTTLDVGISKDSKKALKELIKTEWLVDLKAVRKALEDIEFIKKGLGYVELSDDNPDYRKLSKENKDIQESINKDIEKGIEELEKLANDNEGDSISLWFPYFFSTNGRFFIDSNTINPMTNKHMHRFFVQPKSHKFQVKRVKGKFIHIKGNKDITSLVNYSIAQGFGFKTDKLNPNAINAYAEKVLSTLDSVKNIELAKNIFIGKHTPSSKPTKTEQAILDLDIEFEHYSQALQTFTFLEDLVKHKNTPFTTSISAEFDAVTSGFGLKLLQLPILGDSMKDWLRKVGITFDNDPSIDSIRDNLSMNSLLDKNLGGMLDSYQELASKMESVSFEELIQNSEAKGKNNVVVDNPYTKGVWEALYDVIPKKNIDNTVSSELRSLFKPGFMTFNYSASISTIRRNLASEITTSIVDQIAAADLTSDDKATRLLLAYVNGDDSKAKDIQTMIRTQPLHTIKASKGKYSPSLKVFLEQMVDASYGVQLENILTDTFGKFVEAQSDVNNAFKAMFEVFFAELETKFEEERKKGPISKEKEFEIYESLKDKWPTIKGPLTAMEDEALSGSIGVYDTETAAPTGVFSGRKPARAKVTKSLGDKLGNGGQSDVRVSHMIRKMSAAVSAGSVIPIHHIDGSAIADTVNEANTSGIKGITVIHDAVVPPLFAANEVLTTYNKSVITRGMDYSFIGEIAGKMVNVSNNTNWENTTLANAKVMVKERGKKREEPVELKKFFTTSLSNIYYRATEVNSEREKLFADMYASGFHIMHMAGTPEGVYSVESGSDNPFKPFDLPKIGKYNSNPTINNVTMDDIDEDSQNLCP